MLLAPSKPSLQLLHPNLQALIGMGLCGRVPPVTDVCAILCNLVISVHWWVARQGTKTVFCMLSSVSDKNIIECCSVEVGGNIDYS